MASISDQNQPSITSPLELPCGVVLKNRIAKSAMSENMVPSHCPNEKFVRLYRRWANGGVGLCITGNVMIDSSALGEAGNVVIEKGRENGESLRAWAQAGTENGTALWMQLNHPGRQTPKFLSKVPVSASAVPLKPPMDRMFNCPKELSREETKEIVERFGYAAQVCKEAGFSGVQIHGAHGYLVSQFLSPLSNLRKDEYGGSLENRMRFLKEIYQSIRTHVGPEFPVGLKINSADFQTGGFSEEDALAAVVAMDRMGIDLIEISGGTYESPSMTESENTNKREAYFIDFVKKVRPLVHTPLMLTGGFRDPKFMRKTIENGEIDIVGLARSLALEPEFPQRILSGGSAPSIVKPVKSKFHFLNQMFAPEITYYTYQIQRMGLGKSSRPRASVYTSMVSYGMRVGLDGIRRVRGRER